MDWLDEKFSKFELGFIKIWAVPLTVAYVYVVTILTNYGYVSFYNIPPEFVEPSVRDNILLFDSLLKTLALFFWIPGRHLLIVIAVLGLVILICKYSSFNRVLWAALLAGSLLALPWNATKFGRWIASTKTNYYIPAPSCPPPGSDAKYVIPTFYDGKAILVPINQETKRINGGFLVKEASEMGCVIERQEIGKLSR